VADANGLRERKKQQTYADIRAAAVALVEARGFAAVTIDEIAAAAAVSKSTFYRYFETKEDVLLGGSVEKRVLMQRALDAQPPDAPPLVALRDAFMEVATSFEIDREHRFTIRRIAEVTPSLAARDRDHQAMWEQLLREWFRTHDLGFGGDDAELTAWVLAANVVASLRTAIDYWAAQDGGDDLADVVDRALGVAIGGCHPTGRSGARA
jgi:AcrR family transcriptional regulator